MKHAPLFIFAVVLLAVPAVEADRQSTIEIIIPALGADAPVLVHQTWPELPVPNNSEFYVTFNGYTGSTSHTIDFQIIHLHGGCTINHQHITTVTGTDEALSLFIQMNGADNCTWHVDGVINATGIGGGERARFQITGNAPGYVMHDYGQNPNVSVADNVLFWLMGLVFLVLAIKFGNHGLMIGSWFIIISRLEGFDTLWMYGAGLAFLGLLIQFYRDGFGKAIKFFNPKRQ